METTKWDNAKEAQHSARSTEGAQLLVAIIILSLKQAIVDTEEVTAKNAAWV